MAVKKTRKPRQVKLSSNPGGEGVVVSGPEDKGLDIEQFKQHVRESVDDLDLTFHGKYVDPIKKELLEQAGVSEDDVFAYSAANKTLVTKQGGKFRLGPDNQIQHIMGPFPNAPK